jgi:uncharacterized protein YyaL (SSP411 family)
VNRDKVAAWNAEAAIALLALSHSSKREDLRRVGLRTLEFLRANLVGEQGAFHLYEQRTGLRYGEGQVDANAWTALAFLKGYRVSSVQAHRQAAEQVLRFAVAKLFDAGRGGFSEDKSSPLLLDANGVMADALLEAHQLGGRADYRDAARRVLSTFGGTAGALLTESDEAARAADTVYYLRAYSQVVGTAR